METKDFQSAVAGAVRAELARANRRPFELANFLGVSRPTVAGRLAGEQSFTVAEVDKVASFLGITAQDIMLSAALPARFGGTRADSVVPLMAPERDDWAQPPRSRQRGHTPGHI